MNCVRARAWWLYRWPLALINYFYGLCPLLWNSIGKMNILNWVEKKVISLKKWKVKWRGEKRKRENPHLLIVYRHSPSIIEFLEIPRRVILAPLRGRVENNKSDNTLNKRVFSVKVFFTFIWCIKSQLTHTRHVYKVLAKPKLENFINKK